jgi:hypothetical protein
MLPLVAHEFVKTAPGLARVIREPEVQQDEV